MEAYRDQYATIFNAGRGVVSLNVSADPDTTLVAWAREEEFPMLFARDVGGKAGTLYNTYNASNGFEARDVFVIGPDGRIAHVIRRLNVLSQQAYAAIDAAVDSLATKK